MKRIKLFLVFSIFALYGGLVPLTTKAQYSMNDACTTPFIHLEDSSNVQSFTLDDDGEQNITIPFDFTLNSVTSNVLRIGNNGGVIIGSSGDVSFSNNDLSGVSYPGVYPFWDDLSTGGMIYWDTLGTAPNRYVVIEWYQKNHYSYTSGDITFEVILYEGTNEIKFLYDDVVFGSSSYDYAASATIGITDANGYYLQYSYNQPSLNGVTCIDFAPLSVDASIYSIVSPAENIPCTSSGDFDVSAIYKSGGIDTLFNVAISYSFDGGAWVSETIDTILPHEQDTFVFATPVNITGAGTYPLIVAIHTDGDEVPSNDTLQINVVKAEVYSSFPYFQDFESTQYWTAVGNTTFELGTPSTSMINGAYSGQNAWVTNADSNYLNYEDGYVLSPCFDFTALDTPVVSFAINYNTESCCDGAYLQVTLDEGNTWLTVGQTGDPDNWYNSSDSWRGNSNGWVLAKHVLDTLGGKPSVRFRIVFTSDVSVTYDGFAFDNFRIYEKPAIDAVAQEIISPTGDLGCNGGGDYYPNVVIASNGYDTTYNVNLSYSIDGSTWTTETLDTLLPFSVDTFVFQNPLNLSTPGTYTLYYAVSALNDGDPTNDTISTEVVIQETINTFPYLSDFESTNTWHSEGNTTFELGVPSATNINSAYSGQNAWVTNLTGNYMDNESGYVVSPCFDFSTLDTPIVELAINYNTESCCDGAYLQVTLDEGNTWITVGQTGDPDNWYNSSNSWRGNSNGWIIAKHQLDTLGGKPSVKFRVAFTSDGSVDYEGFAFDDFRIYDKPHNDLTPLALLSPVNNQCCLTANEPVTVSILNQGTMPQDTFDISVSIDGGTTWTTETYYDTLMNLDTLIYTFTQTFDFSTPGNYNVLIAVDNQGDELPDNDTISVVINVPSPLTSIPYVETFDTLTDLNSGWNSVSESSYEWMLNSGSTPSSNTGPNGDHTSGSGYYAYVEASNGNSGDEALLYSPCFDFSGNTLVKITYWYHMYGADITTLYFDVKMPSGWVTYDSIVGQQQSSSNDAWLKKQYVLPDTICQVRFRTYKGADYEGDVAIDDFSVEPVPDYDIELAQVISPVSDACVHTDHDSVKVKVVNVGLQAVNNFTLAYSIDSGTTWVTETYTQTLNPLDTLVYTFSTTVDISADSTYYLIAYVAEANDTISENDTLNETLHYFRLIAPVLEDFETFSTTPAPGVLNNGWTVVPFNASSYTWTVYSGSTPSSSTGPNGDHTTGNGIYLYTEASNGSYGDQTILTSPCIDMSNLHDTAMITFWYHMYGSDVNNLSIEYLNNNGDWVSLGSISGQQQSSSSDDWKMWVGYVPANDFHKIRFVATRGSSYYGDISIDDINISQASAINIVAENIEVPASSCNLTNSEPITITVKNMGTDTINGFNLAYSLDTGNTWTSEFINSSLAPLEEYTHTFTTNADFSNPGEYMVLGLASAMGDTLNDDDTAYGFTMHIPVIDSFEYFVDFENGASYWTTGGTGAWEYGIPANPDTAYSPVNCWATNLDGEYSNNETAYLYTPCFDFSLLAEPEMQFAINYNTESCCDYAYMEYSTDSGATWQILGSSSDSAWYSTSDGWAGNSNGWVLAYHDLSSLAGQPNVKFRFVFYSDGSVTNPGVMIDNFRIYQNQQPDLAVTYPEDGGTVSLCSGLKAPVIAVKNVGQIPVSAGTQFDINYEINSSGTIHTNTVTLSNNLMPGDSVIETFSDQYYFANNSTYDYKMYITFPNADYTNDTVQGQYIVQDLQIDLGPDTIWTTQPDTIVLDAGGPYVSYQWSTGDTTQTITVSDYGTYSVTVTDFYGCEASDSVVVEMGVDNNLIAAGEVAVYPNPSHGLVVIRAASGSKIEITTVNGKVLEEREMTSTKEDVDLRKYGKGIYLIKIVTNDNVNIRKVVIN
jgi:hypothetical protein